MTSHSLLTRFQRFQHHPRQPGHQPLRFLHRFSDSVLHTALMLGLVLLVGLALYEAMTLTINFWRLDTVVVEGKAAPARQAQPQAPAALPGK